MNPHLAFDYATTRILTRQSHSLRYPMTILAFVLLTSSLKAALIQSAAPGAWSAPATWVGGVVPTASDDVEILHLVTVTSAAACNNLLIVSSLQNNSSLTVNGGVTVSGGLNTGANLVLNGTTTVTGTINISGSGGTINLSNFTLASTGICYLSISTTNFGANCNLQGTIEGAGINNIINFNSGSSYSGGFLLIRACTVNDNVGIAPDSMKIVGGPDFYDLGYYNSTANNSIPKLVMGKGALTGSGILTVLDQTRITADPGTNAFVATGKELRIQGTSNVILRDVRVTDSGIITFTGGSVTSMGNASQLGHITHQTGGVNNIVIEAGATINNNNAGFSQLRAKISSAGNLNGKFILGGSGVGTHNLTGGTLTGQIVFSGTSTGATDIFDLSNLAINTTGIQIAEFSGGIYYKPSVTVANSCTFNSASTLSMLGGTFIDNLGLTPTPSFYFWDGQYNGSGSPTFAGGIDRTNSPFFPSFGGSGIVTVNGPIIGNKYISVNNTKELKIYGNAAVSSFGLGNTAKLYFMSGSTVTTTEFGIFGSNTTYFEQQTGSTWNVTGNNNASLNTSCKLNGVINITATQLTLPVGNTYDINAASINVSSGKILSISNPNSLNQAIDFNNTQITGAGLFRIEGNLVVVNINGSSSVSTKLTIHQFAVFNDNVGITPGEVRMDEGGYGGTTYGGTGSPTFANGLIWNAGSFAGSGTVNISGTMSTVNTNNKIILDSKVLQISGTADINTQCNVILQGTSKIIVPNNGMLILSQGNVTGLALANRVQVDNGGTVRKTGTLFLQIPLTLQSGGLVQVEGGRLRIAAPGISNNIINYSGQFNVFAGANLEFVSNSCYFLGPQFNNSGLVSLTNSNSSIVMNGSVAQTIGGTGGRFQKLELWNSQGVTITGSQRVNNVLNNISGSTALQIQAGDLTVTGVTGFSASKYIVTTGAGRLRMNVGTTNTLFPVGPDLTSYNPVTLSLGSGSDTFAVRVKTGFDYPTGGPDYVNRQWTIDRPSGNTTAATTVFQWVTPGHIAGSFTPGNCHVSRWTGIEWQSYGDAAASCVSNTCTRTQTNITNFSPFGVASGTALPVELLAFRAVRRQDLVVLQWSTETERRNRGFTIQRATDGQQFEDIGFVTGKGDSDLRSDYSFDDITAPAAKRLYYRLRQEDTDGTTTYSAIVTVAGQGISGAILLPNPVRDKATLQLAVDAETELSLSVCDMQGRLVHALAPVFLPKGEQLIDLPAINLPDGSYFLRISSVSGIQWLRFIIHH